MGHIRKFGEKARTALAFMKATRWFIELIYETDLESIGEITDNSLNGEPLMAFSRQSDITKTIQRSLMNPGLKSRSGLNGCFQMELTNELRSTSTREKDGTRFCPIHLFIDVCETLLTDWQTDQRNTLNMISERRNTVMTVTEGNHEVNTSNANDDDSNTLDDDAYILEMIQADASQYQDEQKYGADTFENLKSPPEKRKPKTRYDRILLTI